MTPSELLTSTPRRRYLPSSPSPKPSAPRCTLTGARMGRASRCGGWGAGGGFRWWCGAARGGRRLRTLTTW